tara:strand:+ start:24730 stop:26610 length:1881 start_codon:yes stop_codon:yes gene_type:complete
MHGLYAVSNSRRLLTCKKSEPAICYTVNNINKNQGIAMPISNEVLERLQTNDLTLTALDLWGYQMGDRGAEHLAAALEENTTLTSLDLHDNQISDRGAEHLAAVLEENITLTALNLGGNEIGAAGAEHLAAALKVNTTLTSLQLDYNQMGDRGAEHLATALKVNTTLTALDLGGNEIGAAGAEHLAAVLKVNTTLTSLHLWGNQMGDRGVGHLATALKVNTTLTSLHLDYNQMGDRGAEHLAAALQENYRLLSLNGASSLKINALLARNAHIADCLKLLKDFTTPGLLYFKNINEAIETLCTLAPELNDEDIPLPEDNYLSEVHRLLCALSYRQGGYLTEELALLESPMRHPKFAIIADKMYAEALMLHEAPEDTTMHAARYKLLAYCGRHDMNSAEFATGLAGVSLPQGESPDLDLVHAVFSNPRSLPHGAYWLNYEELRSLAQSVLGQASKYSYEHLLLEAVIAQKDYHPVAVNNGFHSPLFIHALRAAYPNQETFQCFEGYLDLQHVEGLGGVYVLPTEADETILTTVIVDLDNTQKLYACVQNEITGLKQRMTSGLALSKRDTKDSISKEDISQAIEQSESGWFSSKHRTNLFRYDGDVENNHASTDEVVENPLCQDSCRIF